MAIRSAAMNGHLDVVQELMLDKRVDASAKNNDALRLALAHEHLDIAKELMKDERVREFALQEETDLRLEL